MQSTYVKQILLFVNYYHKQRDIKRAAQCCAFRPFSENKRRPATDLTTWYIQTFNSQWRH